MLIYSVFVIMHGEVNRATLQVKSCAILCFHVVESAFFAFVPLRRFFVGRKISKTVHACPRSIVAYKPLTGRCCSEAQSVALILLTTDFFCHPFLSLPPFFFFPILSVCSLLFFFPISSSSPLFLSPFLFSSSPCTYLCCYYHNYL